MKTWLITTMAPFYGTEQHYAAYSEEDPLLTNELNEWFWNEEVLHLWDMYSYLWTDSIDDSEWENDFDTVEDYIANDLFLAWEEQCSISADECSEEELDDYVPGGVGHLEVIYDEREQ